MNLTLDETIRRVIENQFLHFHTAMPAVITHYESKNQKAFVKPLIKQTYYNGKVIEMPIIVNVPVIFPHNSKAGMKFPLNSGDTVLVIFSESCLERWLSASSNEEVENGYDRRFDLSDAIAIPCLYPLNANQFGSDEEQQEAIFIFNDAKVLLDSNGKIVIKSKDNAKIILNNDSLEFSNNSQSLIDILMDLATELYNATVQGHNFDNRNVFSSIRTRLEMLKG